MLIPTTYDYVISDRHTFYDAKADMVHQSTFDYCGNYRHRTVATYTTHPEPEYFDFHKYHDYSYVIDDLLDAHHPAEFTNIYQVHAVESSPTSRDYDILNTLLPWDPADTIRCTLTITTQYARGRVSNTILQHWMSRFPPCNVKRCNEAVATDMIFNDIPAVDSGAKATQLLV
jgi:hypothetical protein